MGKLFVRKRISVILSLAMLFSLLAPFKISFAEEAFAGDVGNNQSIASLSGITTPSSTDLSNPSSGGGGSSGGAEITTPSSIEISDLNFQNLMHSQFQETPVLVSFSTADTNVAESVKDLDYKLIVSTTQGEERAKVDIAEEFKEFKPSYWTNGGTMYLLGYLPTSVEANNYNISLEGYNADSELIVEQKDIPFTTQAVEPYVYTNSSYGELSIYMSNLYLNIQDESSMEIQIRDENGTVIAGNSVDESKINKYSYSQNYPFNIPITYYNLNYMPLEITTHKFTGENTVWLIADGQEIQIDNFQGLRVYGTYLQGPVAAGQSTFTAVIDAQNVPNKDYLKVKVVEQTTDGAIDIAELTETAYRNAYVDINGDNIALTLKFKTLEGKSLEKGKRYYFVVQDPENNVIDDRSSFEVMTQPTIMSQDVSKYQDSVISFKTFNFDISKTYAASITTSYMTTGSGYQIGKATAQLNGDTLSFTFKNEDGTPFKFNQGYYYSLNISNDGETNPFYYGGFSVGNTYNQAYIDYIQHETLPIVAKEYWEYINVRFREGNTNILSKENIKSIKLVQADNESNVIAVLDQAHESFEVEDHDYYVNVQGKFDITPGKASMDKTYIYVIETINGVKIRPQATNNQGYYLPQVVFKEDITVGSMIIKQAVKGINNTTTNPAIYLKNFITSSVTSFDIAIEDILNVDDNDKLDVALLDWDGEKIAQVDRETFGFNGDAANGISYAAGKVVLMPNKVIEKDKDYTLALYYDNRIVKVETLVFTDQAMIASMHSEDNTLSAEQISFDMHLYQTLNVDTEKAEILLVKGIGSTHSLDLNKAVSGVVAEFTVEENSGEDIDYSIKVTLDAPLAVGSYSIVFKQGDSVYHEQYHYLTVTDKTMLANGTRYSYDDGVLKTYEINAVNLDRGASYDVYVYSYQSKESSNLRQSEDSSSLDTAELLLKLDKITISDKGSIIFTPEELSVLKAGEYSLFFEMNKKIIGRGTLDIREVTITEPTITPKFLINGQSTATDKREVDLQITLAGYNQIRIAESEAALAGKNYEAVTDEESANKIALRKFILSEGDGQKTLYVQLKDASGKESEILTQTIKLEMAIVQAPFDVVHNGGASVTQNTTIIVSAKSNQNVIGYMELLDINEESITSTLLLSNLGVDTAGHYSYERSIMLSESLSNAKWIKVYLGNTAGKMSESVIIPLSIARLSSVKGELSKQRGSEKAILPYSTVTLQKKNASGSYVNLSTASTDRLGIFNFKNLLSGDYKLMAYDNGKEVSKGIIISASTDMTEDFMIPSEFNKTGALTVTVRDTAGQFLNDASVSIGSWVTGHYASGVTSKTTTDGIITFEGMPTKLEGVEYYVSVYYNGLSKWATVSVKEGANTIDLQLPQVVTISGQVKDKDGKGMQNINVYATGNTTWKSGWGLTDADGKYTIRIIDAAANEKYRVQLSLNSNSTQLPIEEYADVAAGATGINFKLCDGIKVYGNVKTSAGVPVVEAYIYSTSNTQWHNTRTNSDGEFDFGYVFGAGTHTVYTWTGYQYLSQQVVITKEDLANGTTNKIEFKLVDRASGPFTGEGNNVKASVSTIQKGKNVTVKVNIKNNSDIDLTNVKIKSLLPTNVALIDTAEFDNKSEKLVSSLAKGETAELTFIVKVNDKFDGSVITIPAKAILDSSEYNIGFADIEVANITLNGPSMDKDGKFSVYGETVEQGKVTLIDKKSDKALASTTPSGKWYTASLDLPEGDYELIAQVEKNGNTAISDILKVKVSTSQGIEIEDVEIDSPNGQRVGVNKDTGIAAFSAWVNGALQGKDITAKVKVSNTDKIESAKYEFSGKTYQATLVDGYYTKTITGWSGSGNKQMKLHLKLKNGDEVTFVIADITVLIDPSGYVEDKYSSEKVAGATAICEILDGSEWGFWDAAKYGQINPQLTDENGQYGWMVPDGTYRVKIVKEGYEDYITTQDTKFSEGTRDSEGNGASNIIIPPPRTDVNISLVNIEQPVVKETKILGNMIVLTLNKAIDKSTVSADAVVVKDKNGIKVAGTAAVSSNNKEIRFTPGTALASEALYTIAVSGVKDFAGRVTALKELKYIGEIKAPKVETPTTPIAGGGGGGGAITTTQVQVSSNISVATVTENGVVKAAVDGASAVKAIAQAVKDAKANTVPQVVIVLDAIKDANLSVGMSADMIKAAAQGKVDVVITSSEVQYVIPFGALEAAQLKDGDTIELVSKELTATGLAGKAINDKLAKLVEFNLIVKSAEGSRTITKFSKPLEIKINIKGLGSANRLGIYYINEDKGTLELVSRKVEGDFIVMETSHYSKYAVIEKNVSFKDIKGHWAQTSIETLAAKNIVGGYKDGTFKPQGSITRAEFINMLVGALGLESVSYKNQFTDVKANDWFASCVATGAANGLMSGYPNGKFNPNAKISRAEMMSIISRIIKGAESGEKAEAVLAQFKDQNEIAPWAREAAAKVVKAGIIGGINSKLEGKAETTRAQAAAVIYKIYSKNY